MRHPPTLAPLAAPQPPRARGEGEARSGRPRAWAAADTPLPASPDRSTRPRLVSRSGRPFPTDMAKVGLRDVRKSYGELEVIHGVTTDVADGEFIVIVGPSGCGKSTLLRMVAGLEAITAGEIAIGDRVVNDARAQGPRHRDGVPELRAVSAHERVRQHGVRPQDPRLREGRYQGARRPRRRRSSNWDRGSSASRASSPADNGSGSRWAARSCANPRCSSSTSRCPISTPSCACRCASRSRSCIGGSGRRASTSRTIRSRR